MPRRPIDRSLSVTECDPFDAHPLVPIYNALFAKHAPPSCPPVRDDEFAVGMTQVTNADRPVSRLGLGSLRLIQAARDGRIFGFAHVAIETKTWEDPVTRRGLIRVFVYDPSDRAAGHALLAASETYFLERGVHDVCASPWFAPARFIHTGREGVSTFHAHVLALFGLNGYSVWRAEHIMEAPDITKAPEPSAPDAGLTVNVEHMLGRGALPGFLVRMERSGDEIGACECRAHGHYLRAPDAQARLLVEALDVTEAERGRGFGRYLLRRALWEGRQIGHRHADLRVRTDNLLAMMLYASEGFRIIGTGYMLTKSLLDETEDVGA